jgi:glucan phosphoethanolaminetransferase (alkaline phosphatase superfamily)
MSENLKSRLLKQLAFAFLAALIVCLVDFTYIWTHFGDQFPRRWMSLFETWGVVALLTFAFQTRGVLISLFVILFLGFLEMGVLSFYGTFIHPTMIWLFFGQPTEVTETAVTLGPRLAFPVALNVGAAGLLVLLAKSFRFQNVVWRPMKWILALALIYAPIRTAVTGNTYGKQPPVHNMAFSNMYSSFSFFFGRTLPYKLTHKQAPAKLERYPVAEKNPKVNIVFILGESLRYHNLQLFGYEKETTPELIKLSNAGKLQFRKAISGGVLTDVAVPLLINNFQNRDPVPVIVSQDRCLFRLAKENGFETSFYSAQTEIALQHIINYMCPTSIDHMQVAVDSDEDPSAAAKVEVQDELLLSALDKVDFSKPQFVMLHQRGSHSPYEKRYPKSSAKFPVQESDSYEQKMIKHYDNSVVFTDRILSELIKRIHERSRLPTYIVFTSDHGQALGEGNAWGHCFFNEYVFRVPFLYSSNRASPYDDMIKSWPEYIAHKDISNLLISMMGYSIPMETALKREVFVMGADLDGLEGGMLVHFNDGVATSSTRAED